MKDPWFASPITFPWNEALFRSSCCGPGEENPISIQEDANSIPCCELWCRSQTLLRSHFAVAVEQASSCSSNRTPSLGTSIYRGCSPKKKSTVHNLVQILLGLVLYLYKLFHLWTKKKKNHVDNSHVNSFKYYKGSSRFLKICLFIISISSMKSLDISCDLFFHSSLAPCGIWSPRARDQI